MKVGIFGCGNMGQAIALGLFKANVELFLYTPGQTKAQELAEKTKGTHVKDLSLMPLDLDWYVLAFKPQQLPDFHFSFKENSKILSVLAGTDIEKMSLQFPKTQIARLMPNTPSKIGSGANLFYASFDAHDLTTKLKALGSIYKLSSEDLLDRLTVFSGSGPALVFEFARLFAQGISEMAPEFKEANELVIDTFVGSALLMKEEGKNEVSFETLREQVTSKKGVTYEALKVLNDKNLGKIMQQSFKSAYNRVLELKSSK